ncbi:hypothetical protein [Actinokineospora sp. HUAS TT18]|uniref:hypothetical protein n=1 Tax=Actinokineospora sp. HUAS TT18 TaxID=3447451 RepID=UPI003F5228A0
MFDSSVTGHEAEPVTDATYEQASGYVDWFGKWFATETGSGEFRSAVHCGQGLRTSQVSLSDGSVRGRLPRLQPGLRLETRYVDRRRRFALELDGALLRYFVSVAVSNQLVDYSEIYEVNGETFARYLDDPAAAHDFVDACKRREMDIWLLYKPGRDRGWA